MEINGVGRPGDAGRSDSARRLDKGRLAGSDRAAESGDAAAASRGSDAVEISPQARLADLLKRVPAERLDLVNQLRDEIEAGSFDTVERREAAVRALAGELGIPLSD